MQKIYIIKHKWYHSHEKRERKHSQNETIVPLLTAAIILVSHCLTLYHLYRHFV